MALRIDNITSIPDLKNTPFRNEADITVSLNRYLENVVNSGVAPPPSGGIVELFSLVQDAIWSRQNTENVPEDRRLLVLGEDPPEEEPINTEAITFSLEDRWSGQFSQGPAGSGGVREVIHHQRSIQDHPEHLGEKLVTMGRFFDNVVNFNIYARSSLQALKRALWFENVIDGFRWYFRLYRLNLVHKNTRRIGKVILKEIPLNKYSVSFHVRTEDTYQIGLQELKKVVLSINTTN